MTTVEYAGEQYELADKFGWIPLMELARLAESGVDAGDMSALSALYDVIEQCFTEDAWRRFKTAARKNRADGDDLMKVTQQAIGLIAARPTQRSSDSSAGPPATSQNSTAGSSSPVVNRFEQAGRPDLALIVTEAMEAQQARAS